MKFSLTWSLTGDYFDVEPIVPALSLWYADECKKHNSKFATSVFGTDQRPTDVNYLIAQAQSDLQLVNEVLSKLKMSVLVEPNWYDQKDLNRLHKDWIHIQRTVPKLQLLLFKTDNVKSDSFHRLNRLIHQIENSFNYQMRCPSLWREPNPFGTRTFPTGVFNVSIAYVDHGRNAMEKFVNFDTEPNDEELSPWVNIGACIKINLVRPYETEYPKAFLNYCAKHNLPVQDEFIPFGNIIDCENKLGQVREIMNRNYTLPDNYITITKT